MTLLRRLVLCVILAATPASAFGQSTERPWSDEELVIAIGDKSLPYIITRNSVFDDPAVRQELRRTGLANGCHASQYVIKDMIDYRMDTLRPIMVRRVRERLSPTLLRGWVATGHLSSTHHGQLVRAVEDDPEFLRLIEDAKRNVLDMLKLFEPVDDEWRGRFADWNFDGPNQAVWGIACLVEITTDPDSARLAFDGFFTIKEQQ